MRRVMCRLIDALLLLFAPAAAWAEDVTVTTYYPSPRGVYEELRTSGSVILGNVATAPITRLDVRGGIVAANGLPACGPPPNVGYGFVGAEFCYDTGFFSDVDGRLLFYSNSNPALQIEPIWIKTPDNFRIGLGFPLATPDSPLARVHVIRGAEPTSFRVDDSMTATPGDDPTPFTIDGFGRVTINGVSPEPDAPLVIVEGGGWFAADPDGSKLFTGFGPPRLTGYANFYAPSGLSVNPTQTTVLGQFGAYVGIGTIDAAEPFPAKLFIIAGDAVPPLRIDDDVAAVAGDDPTPFVIDADGNVGIGTLTPSAKLEIIQDDAGDALLVQDQAGDPSPFRIDSQGDTFLGAGLRILDESSAGSGDMHVSGGSDGIFYIYNSNTDPVSFPQRQRIVLIFKKAAGGDHPLATFDATSGDVPSLQLRGELHVTDPAATADVFLVDTEPLGAAFATVNGTLNVNGKINVSGGVDPPYVSFTEETHATIRARAAEVKPEEKVMVFWHAAAHRLETYVVAEDAFYTMDGQRVDGD